MKKALITGITGQDGSYLTELLLKKGYEVHGLVRRTSAMQSRSRIDLLEFPDSSWRARLKLHYGDLTDSSSLLRVLHRVEPNEVYNLGAQSHVKVSFELPEFTGDVTGLGAIRLFDAIASLKNPPKVYQAGSSEMFGKVLEVPQTETTFFYPRSPYAAAKVYAHWAAINYREAYHLFLSNGILFNHESPRRGENFVTRKISLGAAAIRLGIQDKLFLGNLDAKRDWGYAKDYVEAMWLMLQQKEADDYVIATGKQYSVRDFCKVAFEKLDLDYEKHVEIDERFYRPTEVESLLGDYSKAKEKFGWEPKTSFKELAELMVDSDLAFLKKSHDL